MFAMSMRFSMESGGRSPLRDPADQFMRLVRQHESVLIRVARRYCHPDYDFADDCVQDAIVAGYRAVSEGKFTDLENFRPWMLRILTNVFFRQSSKRSKFGQLEQLDAVEDRLIGSSTHQEVEHVVELAVMRDDIEFAMSHINEDQRALVVLVDLEGLSYEEAAAASGVPVGTVRSRLNRARLKMADAITVRRMGQNQ